MRVPTVNVALTDYGHLDLPDEGRDLWWLSSKAKADYVSWLNDLLEPVYRAGGDVRKVRLIGPFQWHADLESGRVRNRAWMPPEVQEMPQ